MTGVSATSLRPQTQKALYLPLVIASWICVVCNCGLLFPSKASIETPSLVASACAPLQRSDAVRARVVIEDRHPDLRRPRSEPGVHRGKRRHRANYCHARGDSRAPSSNHCSLLLVTGSAAGRCKTSACQTKQSGLVSSKQVLRDKSLLPPRFSARISGPHGARRSVRDRVTTRRPRARARDPRSRRGRRSRSRSPRPRSRCCRRHRSASDRRRADISRSARPDG